MVRVTALGYSKLSRGTNTRSFAGRDARNRALAVGRYVGTGVATDAAGNRSRPRTIDFQVLAG